MNIGGKRPAGFSGELFIRCALLSLLILSVASGCGPTKGENRARSAGENSPLTMTDPCAMRLHDLSGALLLYHASHKKLPSTLDDVRDLPGAVGPLESLNCPVSSQPYRYDPAGVVVRGRTATLLLFDPSPAHNGRRWGVEVLDSTPDSPLVTKVVSIPENAFVR